jgi:hypothetical protein
VVAALERTPIRPVLSALSPAFRPPTSEVSATGFEVADTRAPADAFATDPVHMHSRTRRTGTAVESAVASMPHPGHRYVAKGAASRELPAHVDTSQCERRKDALSM